MGQLPKLRKNALCLSQSAFSNFALYVKTKETDISRRNKTTSKNLVPRKIYFNIRTTWINTNRININPNDYCNPVTDYYNPGIDYYNLLLRFELCLNLLGLWLMLCKININMININSSYVLILIRFILSLSSINIIIIQATWVKSLSEAFKDRHDLTIWGVLITMLCILAYFCLDLNIRISFYILLRVSANKSNCW